ncbi:MAG: thioesterase family protein [Propionibacteriaceae bacterium]
MPDSSLSYYYTQVGPTTYEPSPHVQGAWRPDESHMAPVAGLAVHALETLAPRPELTLCRLSFEICGVIGLATSEVAVDVVRPGRTIELVQATVSTGGRIAVRASAWRLAPADTAVVAAGQPDPLPGPRGWEPWPQQVWGGGYIDSVEIRVEPGSVPGRIRAWIRSDVVLMDGASELARFLGFVDTMNGIGARVDPRRWMFPNTDLTVHLYRTPRFGAPGSGRDWVGLDVSSVLGAGGVGLTSAVLHDADGPVGRAEQILTVRPLPPT